MVVSIIDDRGACDTLHIVIVTSQVAGLGAVSRALLLPPPPHCKRRWRLEGGVRVREERDVGRELDLVEVQCLFGEAESRDIVSRGGRVSAAAAAAAAAVANCVGCASGSGGRQLHQAGRGQSDRGGGCRGGLMTSGGGRPTDLQQRV